MSFYTSSQHTLEYLQKEFLSIRTGRANPSMLDNVLVEAWGSKVPLNQVATVSAPDATMLVVKPFDKSTLKDIERGIQEADLGLNPIISEDIIRLPIPQLTQETREKLVKKAKEIAEDAKIRIRQARTEEKQEIEQMLKEKVITEDEEEKQEKDLQHQVDKVNKEIDEMLEVKVKKLMEV